MPAHRPARQDVRPRVDVPTVNSTEGRVIDRLAESVRVLEARAKDRTAQTVHLIIGTNRVAHRLGRVPIGANVSPTVVSAAFEWALTSADADVAVLEVVGTDQPGAGVEFW